MFKYEIYNHFTTYRVDWLHFSPLIEVIDHNEDELPFLVPVGNDLTISRPHLANGTGVEIVDCMVDDAL